MHCRNNTTELTSPMTLPATPLSLPHCQGHGHRDEGDDLGAVGHLDGLFANFYLFMYWGPSTGLGQKVGPRFGEIFSRCCLPLMAGLACNIHAPWGLPFSPSPVHRTSAEFLLFWTSSIMHFIQPISTVHPSISSVDVICK